MSLSHALLGLLAYEPATGYDLKNQYMDSIGFFWTATLPQIYRTLSKMEESGWLDCEVEYQSDRPNKKVYSITPDGQMELDRWLAENPEMYEPRLSLLVKVFFGNRMSRNELISHLQIWREAHEKVFRRYDKVWDQKVPEMAAVMPTEDDVPFWRLTLDYGRRNALMNIEWCDAAIKWLEEKG